MNLAGHDAEQGVAWVRWAFDLGQDMVWLGLTDPVWIRRWLGTPLDGFGVGEYTSLGDHVRIRHAGGQIQSSSVLGCEVWRRLEVSWAFPGESTSVVDVQLAPIGADDLLTQGPDDDADAGPDYDAADQAYDAAADATEGLDPDVADLEMLGGLSRSGHSGTELTLTHTGVGEQAREYAIAWHTHLLYLAAALRASPMALDRFWEVHERVSRAYR